MVDNYGAKHFFHHSHIGLHHVVSLLLFRCSPFHNVLYSVRVLYLVGILYPVLSPRFIPSPQSAVRIRSPQFILTDHVTRVG